MSRLFVSIWCLVALATVGLGQAAALLGQSEGTFRFVPADVTARLHEVEVPLELPVDFERTAALRDLGLDESDVIAVGKLSYGDPRVPAVGILLARQDTGLGLWVDRNRDRRWQADETAAAWGSSGTQWTSQLVPALDRAATVDRAAADDRENGENREQSGDVLAAAASPSHDVSLAYPVCFRYDSAKGQLFAATAGAREGQVKFNDRECLARYEDRNANGRWFDADDRLFVDLNGDGKINVISERLPCQGMRTIQGTLYAIAGDPLGQTLAITPVLEKGSLIPRLTLSESQAQVLSIGGTLVSHVGVQVAFDRVDQPVEVPVGRWYLRDLWFEVRQDDEQHYRFKFLRSGGSMSVEVRDGSESAFELLGELQLSATVMQVPGGERGGMLSIHPTLTTETGCYLSDARVGRQAASEENRLTSISQFGENPPILGSTGFS